MQEYVSQEGLTMPATLAIEKMSKAEKLRTMEALWSDLIGNDKSFTSPSWHLDALKETEQAVKAGRVSFVDWDVAKRSLRRRTR